MFTFENKNAFIIGAGRNIGRVIALEFARRGARVAVADINKAGAEETAQLIIAAGGTADRHRMRRDERGFGSRCRE